MKVKGIVKDCNPNGSKPGLDLYLPQEFVSRFGWRHNSKLELALDEGPVWQGTIGIRPPNPPYVHRPLYRASERLSLRDWLIEHGLQHEGRIELAVDGWSRLRFLRIVDRGHTHPSRSVKAGQGTAHSTSTPPRSIWRSSGGTVCPNQFPFDNADKIRQLAERCYWQLITSTERSLEQAFEQEFVASRSKEFLDKPTFVRLARWKSPRPMHYYQRNTDEQVHEATARAFRANEDADAIRALMSLDGVGLRTATALLHWMRPDRFPILDFRVVEALGEVAPTDWNNVTYYTRIAEQIRALSRKLGIDLRTLDRALWAWQKLLRG